MNEKPEGIKYLMRTLPLLTTLIMKSKNSCSGLQNMITNNTRFKLHIPLYNFMSLINKIDKRLA